MEFKVRCQNFEGWLESLELDGWARDEDGDRYPTYRVKMETRTGNIIINGVGAKQIVVWKDA